MRLQLEPTRARTCRFNASEIGTLPRAGNLPRGVSPGPAAYREAVGRTPEPGYAENVDDATQFDASLVHSPRIVLGRDHFRPQSYAEKAALNRGWLDSSRCARARVAHRDCASTGRPR